jgi:hypothetical protein
LQVEAFLLQEKSSKFGTRAKGKELTALFIQPKISLSSRKTQRGSFPFA